jgi:UDP-glucose 4-epimerase
MDRVLITGGMGFLGSHLAHRLLEEGKEVWCLDLFEHPFAERLRDYDKFHLVVDTIKNRPVLKRLIDKVDLVCHLAAIASPDQYVKHTRKVMDITLLSGIDVIEMMRLTGKMLFFTSTSEIYGRNLKVPYSEDDDRVLGSTDIDRWCYSTSKAALEHYIRACHLDGQLDHVTIRVFNCYGPRLTGRVVNRFVDQAILGRPLVVHGDGSQTRCFTWVDDLVDGVLDLLNTPKAHNRVYNIGNPVETSVLELARLTLEEAGADPSLIQFQTHAEAIGKSYEDIPRRVPNISRIQDTIGWGPTTSLREGLRRMIQYRRDELDGLQPGRIPHVLVRR